MVGYFYSDRQVKGLPQLWPRKIMIYTTVFRSVHCKVCQGNCWLGLAQCMLICSQYIMQRWLFGAMREKTAILFVVLIFIREAWL